MIVSAVHCRARVCVAQCDGKTVQLPDVEGIIVLNISSWGSGADLWGSDRDEVSDIGGAAASLNQQ